MFLYIGPGMGAATIVIVAIVLLLVVVSLGAVFIRPIKRALGKKKNQK